MAIVPPIQPDGGLDGGIIIGVYITELDADTVIERAPDSGGSPGAWAIVGILRPGKRVFVDDNMPIDGSLYHYRAYHRRAGNDDSAATSSIGPYTAVPLGNIVIAELETQLLGSSAFVPVSSGGTGSTSYTDRAVILYDQTADAFQDSRITDSGVAADRIEVSAALILTHGGGAPSSKTISTNASGPTGGSGWQIQTDDGAAMAAGDRLGFIYFGGASDAISTVSNQAGVMGYAGSLWTAGSREAYLIWEVTPSGSATRAEVMRLESSGALQIDQGVTVIYAGGLVKSDAKALWVAREMPETTGAPTAAMVYAEPTAGGSQFASALYSIMSPTGAVAYTGELYGIVSAVEHNSSALIDEIHGLNISCGSNNTGDVTLWRGIKIGSFYQTSTGDVVTDATALYISDVATGATNNYAIYTNAGRVRFGDRVDVTSTTILVGSVYGIQGSASSNSSTATNVEGGIFTGTTSHTTGTITTLNGLRVSANATGSGGTTSNVTGIDIQSTLISIVSSWRGLWVRTPTFSTAPSFAYSIDTGALTATGSSQAYGLRVGNVAGATTNYAIYTNAGDVSFGGNVILRSGTNFTLLGTGTAKFGGGGVVSNNAALATTATDGFLYIPTSAGLPTGTPTTQTGTVPIEYDTTNNNLMVYNGGWRAINTIAHLRGFATISSPVSTTSATLVDVTGVTTTITLVVTSGIWAVCTFGCSSSVAGGCVIEVALSINGTDYQAHQRALSGSSDQGMGSVAYYVAGLTAGARIVKLRFRRVSGSGTPQITSANLFAMAL